MYYCRKSKVHGSTVVRKGVLVKVVGTTDRQSHAGLSVGALEREMAVTGWGIGMHKDYTAWEPGIV